MTGPASSFALWGQPQPPAAEIPLRAGPLAALYDPASGFLRRVRLGDHEVLRGLYAAVRDARWGTVPPRLIERHRHLAQDAFSIEFEAEHHQGPLHFTWTGRLEGHPDGSLAYSLEGRARSTFRRNRIGFCILHPIRECAGRPCRVQYRNGRHADLTFPELVAAEQPVRGFHQLAALAHPIRPGLWAETRFEGDSFETEDQRNWIDASFKTYCTPLRHPFPVEIPAGTVIRQSVALRLLPDPEDDPATRLSPTPARFHPDPSSPFPLAPPPVDAFVRLPELGVGLARHGLPLDPSDFQRLAALELAHLRVELDLDTPAFPDVLARAAREAMELGLSLELVLLLPARGNPDLNPLRALLTRTRVDLSRILVLRHGQRSTPPEALTLARRALSDLGVPLGAGTRADLHQLHLQPPPPTADFLAWSMNPQVHALDHRSILETPEAVPDQIRSVRTRHPNRPLVVSPVTLKPRFNAGATGPEPPIPPGVPPSTVDPRQGSLFAAAWTVSMLAALLPAGLEALTLFETTGLEGLFPGPEGNPFPDLAPTEPGTVFPLYHVLRALAGARRGATLALGAPDGVAALLLEDANGLHRLLCANLQPAPRRLTGSAHPLLPPRAAHLLALETLPDALADPDTFWSRPARPISHPVELPPFALLVTAWQP